MTVEIWDVQGRRRLQREYGWRPRGRGDLTVAEGVRMLEPGTYVIRVSSGVVAATERLTVVR